MKQKEKLAELPERVKKAILDFVDRLCKELKGDLEVYLFGSLARGDWLYESDIDLIVVSGKFKDIPWFDRYPYLRKFASKDYGFEILAYTPEEFQEVKRRSIIIKDAMKYWIKLY